MLPQQQRNFQASSQSIAPGLELPFGPFALLWLLSLSSLGGPINFGLTLYATWSPFGSRLPSKVFCSLESTRRF